MERAESIAVARRMLQFGATVAAIQHAAWWSVPLALICFAASPMSEVFEDFGLLLPTVTNWVIAGGKLSAGCWYFLPFIFLVGIAVDSWLMRRLKHTRARWGAVAFWWWTTLVVVTPFVLILVFGVALLEPLVIVVH